MSLHKTKTHLKKEKKEEEVFFIAISYASYLLSVHDVVTCHRRGYGYIHICTQYLIKWMWQTLKKDSEDLNWTTMLIFMSGLWLFCHISSHSVSIKKIIYQQINKNHPKHYPCHISN